MRSVTPPLSGTGVVESLALDHAPLTIITSVGSLVASGFWEKSPPLGGIAWARAKDGEKRTRRSRIRGRAERMFTLEMCQTKNRARVDGLARGRAGTELEGTQEVQQILLLTRGKRVKVFLDLSGFRAVALVSFDRG